MAGGSDRMRRVLAACAAAPPLVALAINVAILIPGAAGGTPPFWRGGALTLSEAAALHDQGELVRLIAAGSDPNARYALRPGVLAARSLTPLEAAVGARRAEVVDLLMLHGATMDANNWTRLHCLAIQTGASDMVETVDRYRPNVAGASCEGVATPF